MTTLYWLEDPKILFDRESITDIWPTPDMTYIEKMNTLSRLIVFLTILGIITFRSLNILIIGLIVLCVLTYFYNNKKINDNDKELNDKELNNKLCKNNKKKESKNNKLVISKHETISNTNSVNTHTINDISTTDSKVIKIDNKINSDILLDTITTSNSSKTDIEKSNKHYDIIDFNLIDFFKLAGDNFQKSLTITQDNIENNNSNSLFQDSGDKFQKLLTIPKNTIENNNLNSLLQHTQMTDDQLNKTTNLDLDNNPYPLVPHTHPNAINTTQIHYPKGTINPIDKKTITKVLNIDTLFRTNYKNTKSSDFIWSLTQPETNVVSIKLSSVDIPISWYNIVDTMERNKFNIIVSNYQDIIQESYTITIPPGNYNNTTFINTINKIFENEDNILQNFYAEINDITKNIVFKLKNYDDLYNENENLEIMFDFFINKNNFSIKQMDYEFQKTVGWNIGFRNIDYLMDYDNSIQGETLFNLKHDDYIFINLDDYNSNCVCQPITSSTWNSYIGNNILGRITIDSSYKNTHYDNNGDHVFTERVYLGPVSLEKFKIQILNKFGETIDLNNSNISFTLELTKIY